MVDTNSVQHSWEDRHHKKLLDLVEALGLDKFLYLFLLHLVTLHYVQAHLYLIENIIFISEVIVVLLLTNYLLDHCLI